MLVSIHFEIKQLVGIVILLGSFTVLLGSNSQLDFTREYSKTITCEQQSRLDFVYDSSGFSLHLAKQSGEAVLSLNIVSFKGELKPPFVQKPPRQFQPNSVGIMASVIHEASYSIIPIRHFGVVSCRVSRDGDFSLLINGLLIDSVRLDRNDSYNCSFNQIPVVDTIDCVDWDFNPIGQILVPFSHTENLKVVGDTLRFLEEEAYADNCRDPKGESKGFAIGADFWPGHINGILTIPFVKSGSQLVGLGQVDSECSDNITHAIYLSDDRYDYYRADGSTYDGYRMKDVAVRGEELQLEIRRTCGVASAWWRHKEDPKVNGLSYIDAVPVKETLRPMLKLNTSTGESLWPRYQLGQVRTFEQSEDLMNAEDVFTDIKGFENEAADVPDYEVIIYNDRKKYYASDPNAHFVISFHPGLMAQFLKEGSFFLILEQKVDDSWLDVSEPSRIGFGTSNELLVDGALSPQYEWLLNFNRVNRVVIPGDTSQWRIRCQINCDGIHDCGMYYYSEPFHFIANDLSTTDHFTSTSIKQVGTTNSANVLIQTAWPFKEGQLLQSQVPFLELYDIENDELLEASFGVDATWHKIGQKFDVSVRWLSVDAILRKNSSNLVLRLNHDPPSVGQKVRVWQDSVMHIVNDSIHVSIPLPYGDFEGIDLVDHRGKGIIDNFKPEAGEEAQAYTYQLTNLEVIEDSDLFVTILLEGNFQLQDSVRLRHNAYLTLKSGQTSIDIDDQFVLTRPSNKGLDYLSWKGKLSDFPSALRYGRMVSDSLSIDTSSFSSSIDLIQFRKDQFAVKKDDSNYELRGDVETAQYLCGWFCIEDVGLIVNDWHHKFPMEFELQDSLLQVHFWPKNGWSDAFDSTEVTSSELLTKLPFHHQGDQFPDSTLAEAADLLRKEYLYPTVRGYARIDTNQTYRDKILLDDQTGLGIGNRFSIGKMNAHEASTCSELSKFPITLVRNPYDVAKTEIEGQVGYSYDTIPFVEKTYSDAYSSYKRNFWDPPHLQRGMWTYGCMHDQCQLKRRADDSYWPICQLSNRYNDRDDKIDPFESDEKTLAYQTLYRTWSFAHYSEILENWKVFLRHPSSENLKTAQVISDNFLHMGMLHHPKGGDFVGAMRHAYHTGQALLPWGNQSGLTGHWINPSGLAYYGNLTNNQRAKARSRTWFENLNSNLVSLGGNRDGIQTGNELLAYYELTKDPRALIRLNSYYYGHHRLLTGGLLNRPFDVSFPPPDIPAGHAMFNRNWIERHYSRFRDDDFLTDFLNVYMERTFPNYYNAFALVKWLDEHADLQEDFIRSNNLIPYFITMGLTYQNLEGSRISGNGLINSASHTAYWMQAAPYFIKTLDKYDWYDLRNWRSNLGPYPTSTDAARKSEILILNDSSDLELKIEGNKVPYSENTLDLSVNQASEWTSDFESFSVLREYHSNETAVVSNKLQRHLRDTIVLSSDSLKGDFSLIKYSAGNAEGTLLGPLSTGPEVTRIPNNTGDNFYKLCGLNYWFCNTYNVGDSVTLTFRMDDHKSKNNAPGFIRIVEFNNENDLSDNKVLDLIYDLREYDVRSPEEHPNLRVNQMVASYGDQEVTYKWKSGDLPFAMVTICPQFMDMEFNVNGEGAEWLYLSRSWHDLKNTMINKLRN